jgi:hypothetical protein
MAAATMVGVAGGIALYDWMTSKGQNLSVTSNVVTDLTVNSTLTSDSSCTSAQTGNQSIAITGSNNTNYATALHNNPNCQLCKDSIATLRTARETLEEDAFEQSGGHYTPQEASLEARNSLIGGAGDFTTCALVCQSFVAANLSQNQTFSSKQNCSVSTTASDTIQQSIKGKIESQLKNQQDITGQLESGFTSNTQAITANLSQFMAQNITTEFRNDLESRLESTQRISIGTNGNSDSLYVNTVSETFTGQSVSSMTVNNNVVNNSRQSAEYSIAQSLLNKNDTIGDLSKDFLQIIDTLADMIDTTTGQILMILGAVLAAIVLVGGGLYMFNGEARQAIQKKFHF